MGKLLVVTPDLHPCGSAHRLTLFARSLPASEIEICLLGDPTPWSQSLAERGIAIHALGSRGLLDLRSLWRLRQQIHSSRASSVCAWGVGAAWPVVLSGVRPSTLSLVAALPNGKPSLALRWLLRHAGDAVAEGQAEGETLRRLGVSEQRLRVVPSGVEVPAPAEAVRWPGLPEDAQVLLVVGPTERAKGQREAVWALDILAFLHERLHLVVAGTGPDIPGVRRFVEITRREDRTHFLGDVPDLAPWLARADVVVVAGQAGGRRVILEAMAAGRPVVATWLPGREELLEQGRTGLFAKPRDIPDLCRQIQAILNDPGLGRTLGENAREVVRQRFPLADHVRAMRQALGLA